MASGVEGDRLYWRPKRGDRIPVCRRPSRPSACVGGRIGPAKGRGHSGEHHPSSVCGQSGDRDDPHRICDRCRPGRGGPGRKLQSAGRKRHRRTFLSNKLVAKRLELLAALVSGAAPIGMLAHTRNPNTVSDVRDALATAAALGRTLHVEKVADASDLDAAVAALVKQGIVALFVAPQADFRHLAAADPGAGGAPCVADQLLEQRLRRRRRPYELRAQPDRLLS